MGPEMENAVHDGSDRAQEWVKSAALGNGLILGTILLGGEEQVHSRGLTQQGEVNGGAINGGAIEDKGDILEGDGVPLGVRVDIFTRAEKEEVANDQTVSLGMSQGVVLGVCGQGELDQRLDSVAQKLEGNRLHSCWWGVCILPGLEQC